MSGKLTVEDDKKIKKSKKSELERILKKRKEIENEMIKLKEKRKGLIEKEIKLKTIIETIGGDE